MARRSRQSLKTETAQAREYPPPGSQRKFTKQQSIDLIRREIRKLAPDAIIVIRGKGGSRKYPEDWWSSIPTSNDFLDRLSDEDLAGYLYDIEDPEAIDIYHRTE